MRHRQTKRGAKAQPVAKTSTAVLKKPSAASVCERPSATDVAGPFTMQDIDAFVRAEDVQRLTTAKHYKS